MDLRSRARFVISGRAHVVLHVAAAQNAPRIDVFKSRKHLFRRTFRNLHNHVKAAAMAHTHDDFDRAPRSGGFENFVNQWNQRGHAFQRKSLRSQISLLQNLLKQIRANQLIQRSALVHCRLRPFYALLDPAAAFGISDVHELHADCTAIGSSRLLSDRTVDLQLRMRFRLQKSQRIEIGFEVAPMPEGVENTLTFQILQAALLFL